MSAEVESAPHSSILEDDEVPQDLNGDIASDNDGDLFGDEDEEVEERNDLRRKLDDSELDSGDDEGRNDRLAATVEDEEALYEEQKQLKLLDVDIARVKPPEGDELYLLNIPNFLGIKHKNFDYSSYEVPTRPHDGRDPAADSTVKFSPFSTANTSLFWRRDPKNPELIQSNSRIVRWSDGSFTLQIASKPQDHYRISTTAMRQGWPKKLSGSQHQDYDPTKETNHFLAAPHAAAGIDLQIVAPFDASMKIQPTGDQADEAELKLRQSIAATTQMHESPTTFKSVKEDPELAKKAAEMFEKERARADRRREAAQDRQFMRRDRVLGKSGLGRSIGGAGLSIAGLEDDDGMPTARGKKATAKRRRTNRRGDIYSDDEDEETFRRRGREDEYDREDDFLAASDEEPEIYEDEGEEEVEAEEDEDVDDLEIEGRQTVIENRTRGGARDRDRERTPKRALRDEGEDTQGEEDGEAGESRRPVGSPAARKKRRVIDDDEDEE
ncbi:uncharacterized protein Z519_09050 [Cladophialophora bantiana CBS 173.52]|uniref:Leo1-like protein n=1 Tax=Cladophialophora bantiana (strain ATCC 10958 / CBS 173.52 / CDC B-1940 / NIH 8579) TaxID=1442370 RepID=A0A0D2HHZ5_CLAB1|nr:uncharacterized protein Z519_09050 [Cladophialophora bantiana CBS 173.52]KIW90405.1 hypothetical protein Z519_09050 [Cladophialophora bantiana CBS 173.52]